MDVMVPAAGQGALAIKVRASDTRLRRLVRRIDDPLTHAPCWPSAGCSRRWAAGACCRWARTPHRVTDGETMRRLAVVASPDGRRLIRAKHTGPAGKPAALGRAVAGELRRQGADEILRAVLGDSGRPERA